MDTKLFEALKIGDYEEIPIEEGEILKIRPDGKLERHHFHYSYYKSKGVGVRWFFVWSVLRAINALKSVAAYQGVSVGVVDALLEEGFSPEEIEEYIYEFAYG